MKALIIGCGVAGPVLALALKKAGIDSVIYEAYPQGADAAGYFLTIASNGLAALQSIGADAPVRLASFPVHRMVLRNHTGSVLGVIPTDGAGGAAMFTIKRRDLYRVLRDEAVAAGIPVRYGKRFSGRSESHDAVEARFEDGTADVGDILIGCDGLHSKVRESIDPAAPRPRYVPLLNTGGYTRAIPTVTDFGSYQMYFGKRAFFAYVPAPDGTIYWFANPPHALEPAENDLAAMTGGDWKKHLLSLFEDDGTPAAHIIASANEIAPPWATYDIPTIPRWSSARSVLVGDAAHATSPSSGQGASMAIEDAVILAKCLRDLPLAQALEEYEAQRRPRVERVVAYGAQTSAGKTAGPLARALRDVFMRLMLKRTDHRSQLQWMFDYRIDWAPARGPHV
jgi:2-polyprenyl-6-methoxyphenol hydroxylase-like FAD-dependent oxidoreductase